LFFWLYPPTITNHSPSLRCTNLIGGVLGRAAEAGKKDRLGQASRGVITYAASHNLGVPTAAQIAAAHEAERSFDDNDTLNEDADQRVVTSTTPAEQDAIIQEKADQTMMSAFEYAQFADFDEEATEAAINMHFPDQQAPESPELAELREKLRTTRATFNVPADGEDSFVGSVEVDAETGAQLERETQDMMDEQLTPQEAAALHAQDGGKGENPYEGVSYRAAMQLRKNAADPRLRRMIALKRQAYGEELSAEDQDELRKLTEAIKNAPEANEGDYALRRTS
jgi:hypothetical protein